MKIKLFLILLNLGLYLSCSINQHGENNQFQRIEIDKKTIVDPWGKSIGDVNGDGLVDLLVGGNLSGGLVYYENPTWKKYVIAAAGEFSTDHEVGDINGDGKNDIISITRTQLIWYQNPTWSPIVIDDVKLHDIEIVDLDNDGDVDIVGRNQSAFADDGNLIHLYRQNSPGNWSHRQIQCPDGEGLKIADLNNDQKPDIIVNTKWYENTGEIIEGDWIERLYIKSWEWPHTFIDVGDINNDKLPDIVLTPAEYAGQKYHISWFEAPRELDQLWIEHIVADSVETAHHFVGVADMDNNGTKDIVTAKMHQGKDPDEIKIYFNQNAGAEWNTYIIDKIGSHSMRLVDFNNDGKLDLFGANWSGNKQSIYLWQNKICSAKVDGWQRHVIDLNKPWRSIFIDSKDLDGDGYTDIITGGWWYKNPGNLTKKWKRHSIGTDANNMAIVFDFDGDNDYDILATQGKDMFPNPDFVWAENNGQGEFKILRNIESGNGDFLQGVALENFENTNQINIALSWHAADRGVQLLTVPKIPATEKWTIKEISNISQDEQLSAADIDRDGDIDLLLGTKWLRNDRGKWSETIIVDVQESPDRNRIADINNDGLLDVVIGFEAISHIGKLAWYEQVFDDSIKWKEHVIANIVGPMSLDVRDMDCDGDIDVVAGEHNLENPESAGLFVYENSDGQGMTWEKHLVYRGDEHHDGAITVDIDNDGDFDIISIGWGHKQVLLYENKSGNKIGRGAL